MRIFAAMDIGTNSVRLAVVEVKPNETWTTLASQKQVVRLGEGEFDRAPAKQKGQRRGKRRAALADRRGHRARRAGLRPLCRSGARASGRKRSSRSPPPPSARPTTGDEFVQPVRDLADLDVRIISGQEEARLIYLGVVSGIDLPDKKRALFMDIGGGSTELIVGDSQGYAFLDSLKMGAIRLTAEGVADPSKPVTPAAWAGLAAPCPLPARPRRPRHRQGRLFRHVRLVGNGAEPRRDHRQRVLRRPLPTSLRNYELSLADVQATTKRLCAPDPGAAAARARHQPGAGRHHHRRLGDLADGHGDGRRDGDPHQ